MNPPPIRWIETPYSDEPSDSRATPTLDRLGRDLTRLAQEGRLRPLQGRAKELRRLQRILLRRQKNNPLLVGLPGVGKTALVEGLAQQIVNRQGPVELAGLRIVELSASSLVAGTQFRGAFEQRLQIVFAEAASDPDLVLFIDEIHTLVRAGAVEGGSLDAANIFKPILARGELRCIGATTPEEYERHLRSDAAFERRFEPLKLDEPGQAETVAILTAALPDFSAHHGVQILPEAVERAVALSNQYILDRFLPDKALDLLDDACATVRLPDEGIVGAPPGVVDADAVTRALSQKLELPLEKLTVDYAQKLVGLEDYLRERIMGQPLALQRIARALNNSLAGLGRSAQPLQVFAFFGSSGVGKTACAQALAEFLFESPDALIRLDMSAFNERYSVSFLFGAPPGYIGYDSESTFAGRLRRQPYAVVLLDEVEKAHHEVLDAFLQIFDSGRFSDHRGRPVDARHAVFILTSNLFTLSRVGSPDEYDQHAAAIRQSLAGYFRPEFVNRIQEIVLFKELDAMDLAQIAEREIAALNRRLADHGVRLEADAEALGWLAEQSLDPGSGARAVLRALARMVMEPLAARLIRGELKPGQTLRLRLGAKGLELEVKTE